MLFWTIHLLIFTIYYVILANFILPPNLHFLKIIFNFHFYILGRLLNYRLVLSWMIIKAFSFLKKFTICSIFALFFFLFFLLFWWTLIMKEVALAFQIPFTICSKTARHFNRLFFLYFLRIMSKRT